MRVIDRTEAVNGPGLCIFTSDLDGPYLDTGFWVDSWKNPYGYIHVPFVEEMGRAVGMVPRAEVEKLAEKVLELTDEVERLRNYADSIKTAERINEELKVPA